jgi:phosphoglycerol transferase MdoB-like AlkP superfamily enzyme
MASRMHLRHGDSRWNRFLIQWQRVAILWLFCIVFLMGFRMSLIGVFRRQIGAASHWTDILAVGLNGLRYDCVVATYFSILPLLFSLLLLFADFRSAAESIRKWSAVVFVLSSTLLGFVTYTYFAEFGDQFNHFIFGIIYDDLNAVLITVWKHYHPLANAIGIALVTWAGLRLYKRVAHRGLLRDAFVQWVTTSPLGKIIFSLGVLILFAAGVRGSVGRRPVQLKDAGITADDFLNKTVLNPQMALVYAVAQHIRLSQSKGIEYFLPDRNLEEAARFVSGKPGTEADLDAYFTRTAKGPKGNTPRHIFLIVAESYSAWPLLAKFAPLGLAEGVKQLAEQGLIVARFLPASSGTMSSLSAIITGLPDAGIHTNYQKTSRTPYPSSLPAAFARLGYRTRFFYGGFLSWQRVGDFCRNQGFEEIYGGGDMGTWIRSNEWGVDDEYLFDFVLKTVDDRTPSFNLILTTSFHPPFDIDVRKKGFRLDRIPESLKPDCVEGVDLNMLGHFWYMDQCIANFAQAAAARLPAALVALTGDHAGRHPVASRPSLYEKYAVPFVLYGKEVLAGIGVPPHAAGSHLDIGRTLLELAAPAGFDYHAMGADLLAPSREFVGISKNLLIGADFIAETGPDPKLYLLSGTQLPGDVPTIGCLKKLYDAAHGIAWWRIARGSRFEESRLPSKAARPTDCPRPFTGRPQ